jgi:beta-1,2-mannobiose phosphorylase / 1,2-beta-oligomannan phosphorylase
MIEMKTAAPQALHRLGIVMEPDPGNLREAEGVLNPAVTRGPDGQLYLLPRLVAPGNYSRIGLARVIFDRHNTPVGVERLGMALEPQEPYELNAQTGGGVEDPRITYLAERSLYVMTYTAFGPDGPRIAAAVSRDLVQWHRTGLVEFTPLHGLDLATVDNKDAVLFPEPVPAPDGRLALGLIHRPVFPRAWLAGQSTLPGRPSIWLSYAPLDEIAAGKGIVFGQHHLLAVPEQSWEQLKVGGGAPPVRVDDGWLLVYHGVDGHIVDGREQRGPYRAGVLLLDAQDPRQVCYRSAQSILAPQVEEECEGVVPQVVFPTGVDTWADGTLDVYYGMADSRIGVARGRVATLSGAAPAQAASAPAHAASAPAQAA